MKYLQHHKYDVFGINVYTFEFIFELADFAIQNPGLYVSLSAESLLSNNKEFNNIIRKPSSFCFADGVGTILSIRSLYGAKVKKLPGCELWLEVLAKSTNCRIAIIGSTSDMLQSTCTKISKEYLSNIVYQKDGYFISEDVLLAGLIETKPRFIFLALGQPKQEILGDKIRELLPQSSIFGVGGSFDVYCGKTKRAPSVFIKFGLEWLYRLLKEPARWKRQLAIPKLLIRIIPLFIKRKLWSLLQ